VRESEREREDAAAAREFSINRNIPKSQSTVSSCTLASAPLSIPPDALYQLFILFALLLAIPTELLRCT
jgi:hypothetical protein